MLWRWKPARNLDNVLHLLNGESKYDRPVPEARVCTAWHGDHPQFRVFAKAAAKPQVPHDGLGPWGWKVATDADDVLRFLRGDSPYPGRVVEAQIAAAWTGSHHRFYVLHRTAVPGHPHVPSPDDWGWRLATDSEDAVRFLNGCGPSAQPVATARIATAHRDHHDEFFLFYQATTQPEQRGDWQWYAADSADGVRRLVERRGRAPVDFQVAAPRAGQTRFQVFTTPLQRLAQETSSVPEPVSG